MSLIKGKQIDQTTLTLPKLVKANQGMVGSVTVNDGDAATATTIVKGNYSDSLIVLRVNGVSYEVGDGVKTKAAYISNDAGATARAFSAVVAGDSIRWNGSIALFQLDATDVLSLTQSSVL